MDLSQIDFEKLRNEFAGKVRRKHAAVQDIRDVVEKKLAQMLARNPLRMDYYKKYQEIIADYNREKDRASVEATFAQLVALAATLDAEQRRAAEEGLSEDELALFDLLFKDNISKKDRERLKQASQGLLSSLRGLLAPMPGWLQNVTTQALSGVLIVLVVAWYQGDRGEQRAGGTELTIVTLLVVGDIFWRYERSGEAPNTAVQADRQASRRGGLPPFNRHPSA